MFHLIDMKRVQQTMGELSVFDYVASAFLKQLSEWRADFALHSNENLTAALAGNSPTMIHAHYKALATKAEAEKWFNVRPAKAAANVVPLPNQTGV